MKSNGSLMNGQEHVILMTLILMTAVTKKSIAMYPSAAMNLRHQPLPPSRNLKLLLLVQFATTLQFHIVTLVEAIASISLATSHKHLIPKRRGLGMLSEPAVRSITHSFSLYPNNSVMHNRLQSLFAVSLLMCRCAFKMQSALVTVPSFVWKWSRCQVATGVPVFPVTVHLVAIL